MRASQLVWAGSRTFCSIISSVLPFQPSPSLCLHDIVPNGQFVCCQGGVLYNALRHLYDLDVHSTLSIIITANLEVCYCTVVTFRIDRLLYDSHEFPVREFHLERRDIKFRNPRGFRSFGMYYQYVCILSSLLINRFTTDIEFGVCTFLRGPYCEYFSIVHFNSVYNTCRFHCLCDLRVFWKLNLSIREVAD